MIEIQEVYDLVKKNQNSEFPKSIENQKDITVYGAGFVGAWAAANLPAAGFNILGFVDSNPSKHGTLFQGYNVNGIDKYSDHEKQFMFIAARHAVIPVSKMLSEKQMKHISVDCWALVTHFDRFLQVHDHLFEDERSCETLRGVMMSMLTGDSRYCREVVTSEQYFCLPEFQGGGTEIYVDAGAYVGDSIERFIWSHFGSFSKIYGFEPGLRQFEALTTRTSRLLTEWALKPDAVTLVNSGLGDAETSLGFQLNSNELQSMQLGHIGLGDQVSVTTLDKYLAGAPVTFIKADVEGMEMALIHGASNSIKTFKPKLAICVYHYPTDLVDIIDKIKFLVPEYKFKLRHHSPRLLETVLYAYT